MFLGNIVAFMDTLYNIVGDRNAMWFFRLAMLRFYAGHKGSVKLKMSILHKHTERIFAFRVH